MADRSIHRIAADLVELEASFFEEHDSTLRVRKCTDDDEKRRLVLHASRVLRQAAEDLRAIAGEARYG